MAYSNSDLNGARSGATLELLERRLASQWAWVRFAVRWRLYRSGYHLHARANWRRAHPHLREYQIRAQAHEMRYLVNEELPEEQKAIFDDDDAMDDTVEQIEAMGRELKAKVQAEMKRREALEQGGLGSDGSVLPRAASTRQYREAPQPSRSTPKPSAAKRVQEKTASSVSASSSAAPNAATAEISLTGRQLSQMHDAEAQILAARAQEVGLIARTSLLGLLTGDDSEAMAFQQRQMQELCIELAPPGSRIEERLLAEVIANARFEALLWQARNADLLATGNIWQSTGRGGRVNINVILDKRAAKAERRYMQALRDLIQLRRALGPGVQVNLIGQPPSQSPGRTHTTVSPIDAVPPLDQASDS